MEKLIELLDEYDKKECRIVHHKIKDGEVYRSISNFNEWIPIWWYSKSFGFIGWLVENDKIEREKFGNSETKSSKYSDYELSYDTPREDYTNILLMELAIQDEPIQFLIEILR